MVVRVAVEMERVEAVVEVVIILDIDMVEPVSVDRVILDR